MWRSEGKAVESPSTFLWVPGIELRCHAWLTVALPSESSLWLLFHLKLAMKAGVGGWGDGGWESGAGGGTVTHESCLSLIDYKR